MDQAQGDGVSSVSSVTRKTGITFTASTILAEIPEVRVSSLPSLDNR